MTLLLSRIAVVFSLLMLLGGCQSQEDPGKLKPISVEVITVQRRDMSETLELSGLVNPEPNQSVKIAALIPGVLTEVKPQIGDWVKAGEVVARLQQAVQTAQVQQAYGAYLAADAARQKTDAGSLPLEIARARAALDGANAALVSAHKNAVRMQTLYQDNIAAGKDVELAVSQEQSAAAQVKAAQDTLTLTIKGARREDRQAARAQSYQARAAWSQAQANLDFTRITTPISGVIAERYMSVGDQAGPASPIMLVVNPSMVVMQASMPVGYNRRLAPGDTAEIIPPDNSAPLLGHVLAIGIKVDPLTNTIPIQIEARNPGSVLKIGMVANTRIILSRHHDVLAIPKECLINSSDNPSTSSNMSSVNRLDHGVSMAVPVKPGITEGNWVEILSGLQPGQQVIRNVGYILPDKTPVEVAK